MFWQKKTVIVGGPFAMLILLLIGTHYDLFHTTSWYDIFMHFLGGALLIFTLAGTARRWQLKRRADRKLRPAVFKAGLIAALVITAIVWEIIEVIFNLTPNWTHSAADTLADIASALAGAIIALHCIFKRP
jgi:uncharacterized membrane-anchored protein